MGFLLEPKIPLIGEQRHLSLRKPLVGAGKLISHEQYIVLRVVGPNPTGIV